MLRLLTLIGTALLGLSLANVNDWSGLEHSPFYVLTASALLCFGLYMAVYGIDRKEARAHLRLVIVAITFGVFCKYILIFSVAFLITNNWHYAILGMAVAQIDPLSVAALKNDQRMTERTRTVLSMWASFDDPVTAIATPLILGIAANTASQKFNDGEGWGGVLVDLAPFAGALVLIWLFAAWRKIRPSQPERLRRIFESSERSKICVALAAGAVVIPTRLYSLAAIIGWFVRPAWLGKGKRAEISLSFALYGATFLLGILLAGGIDWLGGTVLGLATYGSQIVVAWFVIWFTIIISKSNDRSFSRRDTWHLALGQQNGITAIVLALNLEPVFNGAVAVISFAIILINLLHFGANWLFDRFADKRGSGIPDRPVEVEGTVST